MSFSENIQAILLLNTHFTKPTSGTASPLTVAEWRRFAEWLKGMRIKPEMLLTGNLAEHLQGWQDKKVTIERIQALLDRGNAMALALERWERAGIWLITRTPVDKEFYPAGLRKHLNSSCPPLFFGAGNKELLNKPGLAVVGSRKASLEDLQFSTAIGKKCASEGFSVISGGAKGVDEAAMLGTLEAEGNCVGVLADGLLKAVTAQKWRKHLMSGNLALITPFSPEATFSKYDLMGRNKYVYCMSQAALVVHSGPKGGTFSGAEENLKKGWVPLWVKPTDDPEAANFKIVERGGKWCAYGVENISIANMIAPTTNPSVQTDLLMTSTDTMDFDNTVTSSVSSLTTAESDIVITESSTTASADVSEQSSELAADTTNEYKIALQPLYQYFLEHKHLTRFTPHEDAAIAKKLGLQNKQTKEWLTKALEEKLIVKTKEPIHYQWVGKQKNQQ